MWGMTGRAPPGAAPYPPCRCLPMPWFARKPADAAPAATARQVLNNRYRLGEVIGEGAGGLVYDAFDLRTGASVAIKLLLLPAQLAPAARTQWLLRMRREADLARRLQHPDILAVLEAGLQGQQAWLAMERVHGVDLTRYTQPARLLPENVVLHIGARLASALAHAHAHKIVHRDLKPANVMVNLAAGVIKLADFGVAHSDDLSLTRTGMQIGTPAYMAPEQLAGAPATAASDTYALGVVLFELLTGRRPHQADTLAGLLKATAQQPPTSLATLRPRLPAPVVAAVGQLLERDPAQRPSDLARWSASTAALVALMSQLLATAPAAARQPTPSPGQ